MKKSKLLTKKVLIPAVLVVVLLLGLSYVANRKVVADRLAAEAYEEEYGERTSRDGQFLISFNPTQEGKKEAILEDFPGKYYGLTAAGAWHEYEGAPLVEIASEAFGKIADLEKVILPQTVKTIGSSAFAECPALKEVYLPASVVNISEDAFNESPNVTLYVEKDSYAEKFAVEHGMTYEFYTPEPLTDMPEEKKPQAVYGQKYEEDLTYDIIYDYTGAPVCGVTAWNSTSDVKNLTIPNQIDGVDVRVIKEDAFAECHNLDTVVLPETLESVGKSAFRDCEKLRKVCFLENVFSIADDAFEEASQVTICAPKNSYAHYYAVEHGMNFEEWYGG